MRTRRDTAPHHITPDDTKKAAPLPAPWGRLRIAPNLLATRTAWRYLLSLLAVVLLGSVFRAGGARRLIGAHRLTSAWDPMRGVLGIPSAAQMHGDAIGLRADGTPGLPLRPYVGVREETAAQKRIAHTHTCFNRLRSDSLPL